MSKPATNPALKPSSAIRVLFVVNNVEFFISHRLTHALAARESGYDVHVATPNHTNVKIVADAGLTHHVIPMARGRSSLWLDLKTMRSLYQLYDQLRPDIVHHVTIKPVLYGSIAARLANVPSVVNAMSGLGYVFIARGLKASIRRALVLTGYRVSFGHKNSRVIFQNSDDLGELLERGVVPKKHTVLIRGSGVDLNRYVPTEEPPSPVVVILASRLLGDKGIREFVAAARILKNKGIVARFVLAGDIDIANPTSLSHEELREWQREGIIEWDGYQPDMPAVFAKAHIVCLPSYQEGLPKVLIEAAACGRPIVTTDVPGCRDVVDHGIMGLLVPARTVQPLADALETLIADSALRVKYGKAARAKAADFNLDTVIGKTLAVYRSLQR